MSAVSTVTEALPLWTSMADSRHQGYCGSEESTFEIGVEQSSTCGVLRVLTSLVTVHLHSERIAFSLCVWQALHLKYRTAYWGDDLEMTHDYPPSRCCDMNMFHLQGPRCPRGAPRFMWGGAAYLCSPHLYSLSQASSSLLQVVTITGLRLHATSQWAWALSKGKV